MSPSPETRVAVVGAGVAGLGAALELRARGVACRVLEAEPRAGGVVGTDLRDGYRVERGPNAFLVRAPALAFLERSGLRPLLVPAGPEARTRFLFDGGELRKVPSSLVEALATPLLSARGKLRLAAEPWVARGDPGGESVADFVRRRLGPEALERLVAPFLVGVYAGDVERLGVEAVFPSLAAHERAHGSIARGALASALRGRHAPRGLRGSHSAADGLGSLVARMAAQLGDALETGARVVALARDGDAWRVERESGPPLRAGAVVLAVPAGAAAALLCGPDPEAAELLAGIAYAPLATVALGLAPGAARTAPHGFGFLVGEAAGLDLLGALFMSRVFPGRAPEGRELVMAMLGGVRWPGVAEADDDEIVRRAGAGLEATLGLRELPAPLAIRRWPRAVPQPGTDHPRRVARLHARASAQPGLALAGSYLEGIGVGEALVSGVHAAARVVGQAG